MTHHDRLDVVRPLLRTRQVRDFTAEPVSDADLHALTEVARWTGSSQNQQPWRFLIVRDTEKLRRIAAAGLPQTRALQTAVAGIVIVLPNEPGRRVIDAYDDGRVAERLLVAARLLDLGAGITFVRDDVQDTAREILGLPGDRRVETIVALGHPTDAARRPKSAPGKARLPRDHTVFEEHWPQS